MGDATHARHGPQVTAGMASLAAGHSGIRPQQRLPGRSPRQHPPIMHCLALHSVGSSSQTALGA